MTTYIRYVRSGLEFRVAEEMTRRGIPTTCPVFKFLRREGRGDTRKTVLAKKPALPNVILAEMQPLDHGKLENIKGLSPTHMLLTDGSRRDVSRFLTELDRHNEAIQRQYAASGALTPEFDTGALVRITAGPMADMVATFRRVVMVGETMACRVAVSMMGREAAVDVHPDELRAAE